MVQLLPKERKRGRLAPTNRALTFAGEVSVLQERPVLGSQAELGDIGKAILHLRVSVSSSVNWA